MKLLPKLQLLCEIYGDMIEDVVKKYYDPICYFDFNMTYLPIINRIGDINRRLLKYMKDGSIICPTEPNPNEDKQLHELYNSICANAKEINRLPTLNVASGYMVLRLQKVLYEFGYLMHEYGKKYHNTSDFRVNIMEMFPCYQFWYGIDGMAKRLK